MVTHHDTEVSPARALLVIWATEALAVAVLASRLLGPIEGMTGFSQATDVPPGAWFLAHPPLARDGETVAVRADAPLSEWLQYSADASYCCWRRPYDRRAYPGYATETACRRALDELRERGRAPLALRVIAESPGPALAAARCVHVTDLWKPISTARRAD